MTPGTPTPTVTWATAQELDFLRNLGTYTRAGSAHGQRALWDAYLDAMPRRAHWGQIDREVVATRLRRWLKEGRT